MNWEPVTFASTQRLIHFNGNTEDGCACRILPLAYNNGVSVMKIASFIVLPATLLFSVSAFADSFKQINQVVDASTLESVKLEISVGELDIEVYDGEEIQLEIDIEAQRGWWPFRRRDVEHVELEMSGSGSDLYLGIDERNIGQHWRVMMPAKLALEIEVGVGDIHIEEFTNSLDMEVGVGSVRVEVADTDYRLVHATAGVGDATIRGFATRADNERNFISAESYYHGEGELEIEIEVGVGDVEVRNN